MEMHKAKGINKGQSRFQSTMNVYDGSHADRWELSKDDQLSTEGLQSGKPRVPSNGQNWEHKDIAPRVTFLPWHVASPAG